MLNIDQTRRANFRIHLLEGAMYIGSGALLSAQTIFPALLSRLGADNLAIGALPVIAYLFFLIPQLVAAERTARLPFRKPLVLRLGLIQRLHIAALALVVMLLGRSMPHVAVPAFFVIYASNQALAGMASPAWYDLTIKTIAMDKRGMLMGLRVSLGSAIGFANGMLVTVILATLVFPYDYGLIIGMGFVFQLASVIIQRRVVEWEPSVPKRPAPPFLLAQRVRTIVTRDRVFVRFLMASSFLVIGFSGVGFFTVSALRGLRLQESVIGFFTVLTISAQILSGVSLGALSDRVGTKVALIITALSLALAETLAAYAGSVAAYAAVFICVGVNLGAELMARYNFAAECAPAEDRPLYVGLMNAWLAPWYLCSLLAGWFSNAFGYRPVFIGCAIAALIGAVLLLTLPNPRLRHLAVSSK